MMVSERGWRVGTGAVILAALLLAGQRGKVDAADDAASLAATFSKEVAPFLQKYCVRCHHVDEPMSGVRVDALNGNWEERHLKLWQGIQRQIAQRAMPPEDEPQPSSEERERLTAWIARGLQVARQRPTPKNGGARRLTVAQYRNTLRELLQLEDELTEILPPDAVSREGFVNQQETLALSPLQVEAYFDIADEALRRVLVDPRRPPTIQCFRVELGTAINRQPCPDRLILGADSLLLNNEDFVVTQPAANKPFPFQPFLLPTKYRFIEGYQGNDTVRGWRDFDSIYHAVFACMRGTHGYPKGRAYSTVPEGLLLRPAIPSAEEFGVESTYGPRANFKISLRQLPDEGRFRVTVLAARYDDGLLLDPGTPAAVPAGGEVVEFRPGGNGDSPRIPQSGIYQVDVHLESRTPSAVVPDASRLQAGLIGVWPLASTAPPPEQPARTGQLTGDARYSETPLGRALSLDGQGDALVVPRHESMDVGTGDFTVAAWIQPRQLRQAGIVCLGKYSWTHGWYLDMPDNQGVLRIETVGPDNQPNGTIASPPGTLRTGTWQHVAAVVRRGGQETRLFVNGYPVAQGQIGAAPLDNPRVDLHLGRIQGAHQFQGELAQIHLYRRALGEAELQALVAPGRQFVTPPPPEKPQELTLELGERQFVGTLNAPPFLAVRLPAGPLPTKVRYAGSTKLERIAFTRLADDAPVARQFAAFEQRVPLVGVHLGLRRDCGSTLSPVGPPQPVRDTRLTPLVFTGALRNFPSPDVEPDNVNYLAGIREIGVRSEYTDGRDMPRLLIRSVEFEGPYYDDWPPAPHRQLFPPDEVREETADAARRVIGRFATRAFRRPVRDEEIASLVRVFEQSQRDGRNWQDSVRNALLVVLTSPQFLLLVETSATPAAEPLDDYELASKLSYFLWNGPPDERLLERAAEGRLRAALDEEVERLIADPRFTRFINEFTGQWLTLDKFAVLEPDRQKFPRLTRDTRAHLRHEPARFLEYLVRENLPARNLLESDFVLANEVVASYYELADRPESGWQFVPIRHQRPELGGLLSQPAVLAGLSDGREGNPIKRGAWLARKIVAEPPDDPPPNVPALQEETGHLSLRERLEKHRQQPGCAQCHSQIDPWGLPFEEFDAGGRWKKAPVDARAKLPDGAEADGFLALRRHLADERLDQVAFSFLKHLSIYATGRSLTYNEVEWLRQHGADLRRDGYRTRDMIRFVVQSPLFLEK